MKLIKPVLWTVLGVVIGVTAVLTGERVQARQGLGQPAPRVSVTAVPNPNFGKLSFVKDTRSGGCWIASGDGQGGFGSMAVAPFSACD